MANVAVPMAISYGVSAASRLINPGQKTTNRIKNEAQRLENLGSPESNYGYPIRELLGVCRVDGCSMIWSRPLREEITTNTETQVVRQGKGMGGSRQTTITETETAQYFMSAAFLIGGEINRLLRVWANGVQIYNLNDSNEFTSAWGQYVEVYTGNQSSASPTIINAEGSAPTFKGYSYIVFDDYPIELYKGSGFPKIDIELEGKHTSYNPERLDFESSITHITSLAGVDNDYIDLSNASPGVVMYGAVFENNGETYASYLDDLVLVHGLDYREENGILSIYNRTSPDQYLRIPQQSLAARRYEEELGDLYQRKKLDPISLPSEVRVEFLSRSKSLSRNNVFYQDPAVSHSKADRVSTRIVTNESDMTSLAARLLYQAKTEAQTIDELYLLPCWAGIRVGDFIGIQEKAINRIYRVTEVNIAEDYRVKIAAVGTKGTFTYTEPVETTIAAYTPVALPQSNFAEVTVTLGGNVLTEGVDYTVNLTNNTITPISGGAIGIGDVIEINGLVINSSNEPDLVVDTNYESTTTPLVGTATLTPLDIPRFSDSDAKGTLYIAVDGDANWTGGGIYLSRDGGASYAQVASISQSSITGTVAIAAPNGSGLDITTVIRVSAVTGLLSSVTQTKFDLGQGLVCLVGDEIIMARDATLISPGVYDLSYLQRGYRGTEWAAGGHGANEDFVLLSGSLAKVVLTAADIGRTLRLKAVGLYGSEPAVTAYASITYAGASFPVEVTGFSPTQAQVGDEITIYGSRFTGATDATVNGISLDSFVVVSDGVITGLVGSGSTTGKINVATPTGTAESLTDFVVGVLNVVFADIQGLARDNADLESELDALEAAIAPGTTSDYWRGDKTWQPLNKSAVGLGNVENTADIDKPISTATQTALNGKFNNPTGTTAQYIRGDGSLATFPAIPTPPSTVKTFGSYNSTTPTVATIYLFTATTQTTINELRGLKTTSGTCTISIQINGVNVTGLTNLIVTSTPQNPIASGANIASVGQDVTLVISAVSSPDKLQFTLGATIPLT